MVGEFENRVSGRLGRRFLLEASTRSSMAMRVAPIRVAGLNDLVDLMTGLSETPADVF